MTTTAFKDKYLSYHGKFYAVAYRMLHSQEDAQDVVQDVYVRLWNIRNDLERVQNFEAYGVTMVRNKCLDRLRSVGYMNDREQDGRLPLGEPCGQAEQQVDVQDSLQLIRRLAQQLPAQQQQIFELKYFRDLSVEEIQSLTGLTEGNIRVLIHRARTTITAQFNQINTHDNGTK